MEIIWKRDLASALDHKTEALAYIAVLAVMRFESNLLFHVKMAKSSGTTKNKIISSILVGLPAVGNGIIQSLPIALEAFDSKQRG